MNARGKHRATCRRCSTKSSKRRCPHRAFAYTRLKAFSAGSGPFLPQNELNKLMLMILKGGIQEMQAEFPEIPENSRRASCWVVRFPVGSLAGEILNSSVEGSASQFMLC